MLSNSNITLYLNTISTAGSVQEYYPFIDSLQLKQMHRNFGTGAHLAALTKDQAAFLTSLLPRRYSLLHVKRGAQHDMSLEELRFWECGGSYDFEPLNLLELVKQEYDPDGKGSTEGVNSVGEESPDNACSEMLCKIEACAGVIEERLQEESAEHSPFQPPEPLAEPESGSRFGLDLEQSAFVEDDVGSFLFREPDRLMEVEVSEPRSDFLEPFELVQPPQHLLPYIQKKGVRRRQKPKPKQKPASKRKERKFNRERVPQPPAETEIPSTKISESTPQLFIQSTPPQQTPPTTNLVLPPPKPLSVKSAKSSSALTAQQKNYLCILEQVRENRYDKLFEKPLSAGALEHVGYKLIEHKQLSLPVIEANIRASRYEHLEHLHRDLLTVWLTSFSFKPAEPTPPLPSSTSVKVFDKAELKSYLSENGLKPSKPGAISKRGISAANIISAYSVKERMRLADDIKLLGAEHLPGVWSIVSEGTGKADYEILFDLEIMEDHLVEKLIKYVHNILNKQENKKQRFN